MAPWLDALTRRGGPLVPAARLFLNAHPGAPPSPLPRGVEGLRRLAEALDAWAEQEDEPAHEDDERFVEGAGALFGCLLLDHFTDGAHAAREGAHRLRLGKHGFVDPFRVVESALEGPCARTVLVEEIGRAEDEATARAGIGRALRLLERQLAEARPELAIQESFEQHVRLSDDVELDLARLLTATEGEDERAVARAIDKLVSMLPGGPGAEETSSEEARTALLPRLVPNGFLDAHGTELALFPFHGVVRVALILGYEGRSRYVRRPELERWGLDAERALSVALANLAARSTQARFARVDTSAGPLVVARSGDGLDGARLLLPTLHDVLGPELGSPFLAAAPHRDALFACAAEPATLRAALASRVREDAARAPHRVSERLFTILPKGVIRPWSEP